MQLNEIGSVVRNERMRSPNIRREIGLDEFNVMPNHIHGIVLIRDVDDHRVERGDQDNSTVGISPRRIVADDITLPDHTSRMVDNAAIVSSAPIIGIVCRRIQIVRHQTHKSDTWNAGNGRVATKLLRSDHLERPDDATHPRIHSE